jgi:hypothetical protein
VFALIAVAYALLKVAFALLLAFVLWYGVYGLAGTECEEPDCSWLADNLFGGRSVYFLAVCVLVAAGLVWGIPAVRRKRKSHRAQG